MNSSEIKYFLDIDNDVVDIKACVDCKKIGWLNGKKYKEHIEIWYMDVDEDYRRMGIATNMFKTLIERYPNDKFCFGYLTDNGCSLVDFLINNGVIELARCQNSFAFSSIGSTHYD